MGSLKTMLCDNPWVRVSTEGDRTYCEFEGIHHYTTAIASKPYINPLPHGLQCEYHHNYMRSRSPRMEHHPPHPHARISTRAHEAALPIRRPRQPAHAPHPAGSCVLDSDSFQRLCA